MSFIYIRNTNNNNHTKNDVCILKWVSKGQITKACTFTYFYCTTNFLVF